MASRKTRKREYIPPTHEVENRRATVKKSSRTTRTSARSGSGQRMARPILEPSWKRQIRRIPLVFAAFFVLQLVMNGLFQQRGLQHRSEDYKLFVDLYTSVILALLFVPVSYWMESSVWRRRQREIANTPLPKRDD